MPLPAAARSPEQGTGITPRYFTLNDLSGYLSLAITEDPELNERREEDTLPQASRG
ncbi:MULTISPECIES: hypothetical protein [Micrococcaceae]|jgi:hypothetical protein|nr:MULTISPECIES: hypothetical protein [Micrococcaceae]